jgi:hypothetical protein
MVIAMIAMGMVQPSIYEVIDVVPMRHGLVRAGRTMLVRAAGFWRALHGIGSTDCDNMLVNMILVHVMEMTIMEIIDMTVVTDRRMPTVGTMPMGVVMMMLLGAGGHGVSSFFAYGNRRFLPCGSRLHALSPKVRNARSESNRRYALPRVVF